MVYDRIDRPPGIDNASSIFPVITGLNNSTVSSLFSGLGFVNGFNRLDTGEFKTELLKPLPTGGVAGVTFRTDYFQVPSQTPQGIRTAFSPDTLTFVSNLPNPSIRPAIDFTFEQPLLRGAGVLINQIRDTLPPGVQNLLLPGGGPPGILIARISLEESRLEFERRVHELVFTVEEAYWELYCAYWDLYSREAGMRQALAAWQVAKGRYALGGVGVEEVAQIEAQYQTFRRQRLEALGNGAAGRVGVLEAERRLHYVVGLPPEDGTRLIPSDRPVDAPYVPDWAEAVAEARTRRPELLQIEQEVKAAELGVLKAKDLRLPDLRFIAKYNVNGLAQTLGRSLDDLGSDRYNDWELGLLLQVPLGFREGNAEVARAKPQLARRFLFLRDEEGKLVLSLQRSHRAVVQLGEELRIQRSVRQAAAVQLTAPRKNSGPARKRSTSCCKPSGTGPMRCADEYLTICRYNVALADYERQKGTILQYDNVSVVEGKVPAYAEQRASEHIRERTRAIALRNVFHNQRATGQGRRPGDRRQLR